MILESLLFVLKEYELGKHFKIIYINIDEKNKEGKVLVEPVAFPGTNETWRYDKDSNTWNVAYKNVNKY